MKKLIIYMIIILVLFNSASATWWVLDNMVGSGYNSTFDNFFGNLNQSYIQNPLTYENSTPITLTSTTFGLMTCADDQILKMNGVNWNCEADTGGGGDAVFINNSGTAELGEGMVNVNLSGNLTTECLIINGTSLCNLTQIQANITLPIYAYGYFDGSDGGTILADNINCTRTDTGRYTITFTNDVPSNENYSIFLQIVEDSTNRDDFVAQVVTGSQTITDFDVQTTEQDNSGTAGEYVDVDAFYVSVIFNKIYTLDVTGFRGEKGDIGSGNTTAEMITAVNNSAINASNMYDYDWSNIVNQPSLGNSSTEMRDAINISSYYQLQVNWSNVLNKFITAINTGWVFMSGTTLDWNESMLYTKVYNESEVDGLLNAQDSCSEITGCIENAITNSTMNHSVDCSNIDSSTSNLCTLVDTDTTYSAGNGISLSSTTFSVAGNTALTQDADGLSVTNDGIGDTQLEYDTGQALTTTSTPTFATLSTGQGQYELYAMNQNIQTTDDVIFNSVNITGNITAVNCIVFDNGFKIGDCD